MDNSLVAIGRIRARALVIPRRFLRLASDRCDRDDASAKKQMHMMRVERPRITGRSRLLQQMRESFKKIPTVFVILENRIPFDSSNDDMMRGTGGVNAGFSWQVSQISIRGHFSTL
jgi:hypothetical protein